MKMSFRSGFGLLTVLILATILSQGCQTKPRVDWNSRIGSYTLDQAVTDLGPPDKQATLSDGKKVAEWITHRRGGSGFSVGTGFFSGPVGVGVSQSVGSGRSDVVLKLIFSPDNKLLSWSKTD